jgi:hypothetical protein
VLYEQKGNLVAAENVRAMLTRTPVQMRGSAKPRR